MAGFTYNLLGNTTQVIVTRSQDRLTQYFTKGVMTYEYSDSMIIFRENDEVASILYEDIEAPEFDINDPITLLYALGLLTPPPNITQYQKSPFSIGFGKTQYTLPTQNEEYLLFLFRGKVDLSALVQRTVYETFISILSNSNDDILIKVAIGQIYDYTFLESDYVDVSVYSYMQYTRPNVSGLTTIGVVPANVKVVNEGLVVLQKYGRDKNVLSEWMHIPVHLPSDGTIQYSISIIGLSTGAKIYPAVSWVEQNPII